MLLIDIKTVKSPEVLGYLCDTNELIAFNLPITLCGNGRKEKEYLAAQKELLDGIAPWIVETYRSKEYMGIIYGEETQIYVFQSNPFFREFLCGTGGLANWLHPRLPEDLCFLDAHGNCHLKTITHEEECRLFDETEEDVRILTKGRVCFERYDNDSEGWIWDREKELINIDIVRYFIREMGDALQDYQFCGEENTFYRTYGGFLQYISFGKSNKDRNRIVITMNVIPPEELREDKTFSFSDRPCIDVYKCVCRGRKVSNNVVMKMLRKKILPSLESVSDKSSFEAFQKKYKDWIIFDSKD